MRSIVMIIVLMMWSGMTIQAGNTPAPFGRCVNLGNMLEAPNEGEWGLVVQEDFFATIADAGFTAVRIPTKWSGHADANPPYTIHPTFLVRITEVVNWALDAGLQVILNIHHYDEIMVTPDAHTARVIALWEQIATHFSAYPDALAFELLNEPFGALTDAKWNALYPQLITTIRQTNPTRRIVFGGTWWNSFDTLDELILPADKSNLIATFHYYLPFEFTHQGAEWVDGSNAWLGQTWGTPADYQTIMTDFDWVRDWADANHIPILLGEFGAYYKADQASRLLYTEAVRMTAEAHDFSWCYWEFAAGFGIYDVNTNQFNDLYPMLIPHTFTHILEMNEQVFLDELQTQARIIASPLYPLLVDITPNGILLTLRDANGNIGTATLAITSPNALVRVQITATTGAFVSTIYRDVPQMVMLAWDHFLSGAGVTSALEGVMLTTTAVIFGVP
jgi:endoglucanase